MSFGKPHQQFKLLRWFSLLSCLAIMVGAMVTGAVLSSSLVDKLLEREAAVMTEFVNSILRVEETDRDLGKNRASGMQGDVEEFFKHLGQMPGVLRANVYGLDRMILWSSDSNLTGKAFELNDALERAFRGAPHIELHEINFEEKEEHAFLKNVDQPFIEAYLPVVSSASGEDKVVSVVEVYRTPRPLIDAIAETKLLVWASAIGSGILLFVLLFWVVLRADRIMRQQSADLLESEKLIVIGEMATAVAHSLRNPLASMRSSAELALEFGPSQEIREQLEDIMAQNDRLGQWVGRYLVSLAPEFEKEDHSNLSEVISSSLENFQIELDRRKICKKVDLCPEMPEAAVNYVIVGQLLNGLIANAIEAMPEGGALSIRAGADNSKKNVLVEISDTGPGMSPEEIERAFEPFHTSKTNGLGVGLPLARGMIMRHGGSLSLTSGNGEGVTAKLALPVAEAAS